VKDGKDKSLSPTSDAAAVDRPPLPSTSLSLQIPKSYTRPRYEEGSSYQNPRYEEGSSYQNPRYEEGSSYQNFKSPRYEGGFPYQNFKDPPIRRRVPVSESQVLHEAPIRRRFLVLERPL